MSFFTTTTTPVSATSDAKVVLLKTMLSKLDRQFLDLTMRLGSLERCLGIRFVKGHWIQGEHYANGDPTPEMKVKKAMEAMDRGKNDPLDITHDFIDPSDAT